ncbi:hypothetical protein NUSPORA_01623 [Nucleospora cyclopteri]
MFDYNDFQKILKETQNLMQGIAEIEAEESKLKIECNLKALKIIASKIEDESLKEEALLTLESLGVSVKDINSNKNRKESNKKVTLEETELNALVEEEMLKNSCRLREMTAKFGDTLEQDKKVLGKATQSMSKNTVESTKATRTISKNVEFSSLYYFSSTISVFLIMFLIIKIL